MNYNEKGLIKLKGTIESYYRIKLQFTENYFKFPKFINEVEYQKYNLKEISENFKIVLIKSLNNNIIRMDTNGKISLTKNMDKDFYSFLWYITINDDEIILFSNSFYLAQDKKSKNIIGQEFMQRWKYKKKSRNYLLNLFRK